MSITCIRRAAWIVAWDAALVRHVYLRDGDLAFDAESGSILQVGGRWSGSEHREIDGRERLVMPGLINIHCHPAQSPLFRGYVEEFGDPRLFQSGRGRFRQAFLPDADAQRASARFGLAELLANGTTTVVDLSHAYSGWLELLAESGIRACAAPMFRSATWRAESGQETLYDWHADLGAAAFREAIAVMDEADRHPSGRLSSMVSPAQIDTCTVELLQQSAEFARRTGRPLHTHAAQSYAEFASIARRHDLTAVELLDKLGFLSPRTIIGHCVFTDEHPWIVWSRRNDLQLLSKSGSSIAHCPTVFARDGSLLHDLGRYMDAGVNIAIGTDTHPQNMIEEMRTADLLSRVAAGARHSGSTDRVFHAATIGAARVLGRDDLGRLAPGARADIVLCDLAEPGMQPVRDPLRSLIHVAADRAIRDVFVDGREVVAERTVLTIDAAAAAALLSREQTRIASAASAHDPRGADVDELAPVTLPLAAAGWQAG